MKYTGDCTSGQTCVFSHSKIAGQKADSFSAVKGSSSPTGRKQESTTLKSKKHVESTATQAGTPESDKAGNDGKSAETGSIEGKQIGRAESVKNVEGGEEDVKKESNELGSTIEEESVVVIDMASENASELLDKLLLDSR
jgi:hypothetical protein